MRESNQTMAEVALNLYRECLRKVLMQRGGYECQETEGSFMLSFYNCIDAVQFCILVRSHANMHADSRLHCNFSRSMLPQQSVFHMSTKQSSRTPARSQLRFNRQSSVPRLDV